MSDGGKGDKRRPGEGFGKGYDLIDWSSRKKPEPLGDADKVLKKERRDRDKTKF